jgi:hypothetical protein
MKALSSARLRRLQEAQAETLFDVCVIQTATETKDALNARVATWADSTPLACGIDMSGGQQRTPEEMIVTTWDATLRLAKGTAISPLQRIKLLEKHGEPVTGIVYQVHAIADGPSGLMLRLQKLEPSA